LTPRRTFRLRVSGTEAAVRNQEPPLVMFRHTRGVAGGWRRRRSTRSGAGLEEARSIRPQPDLAWNNVRVLWTVRDDPLARELFLDSLAASTALASRMLLVVGLRLPRRSILINRGPWRHPFRKPMTFLRYRGIAVRLG
jgi:hypothetical protein